VDIGVDDVALDEIVPVLLQAFDAHTESPPFPVIQSYYSETVAHIFSKLLSKSSQN
jgi:hypothetical protein